jgi:hypothetical protein
MISLSLTVEQRDPSVIPMYSARRVFIHHTVVHRIRTTEVIYCRIFWYIYETKTGRVVESWYKIKFNAPQHLPIYHKTTNTDPVTSNAIHQTQDRPRVNARHLSHICFLCTLHFSVHITFLAPKQ